MKHLINYKLLFLCPFFLAACGNEDETTPILPSNQPDAVELGITAGVTLTKAAVTANTELAGGIAVYAGLATASDGNTPNTDPYISSTLKNNYAVYTSSDGSSWTNSSTTDKIYLTSQKATIFAHYPAYKPTASGDDAGALVTTSSSSNELKASESDNKVSSTSTINVTVFPGKSSEINAYNYLDPTTSNAEKIWSNGNPSGSWGNNTANKDKIISAPGEVDYMWATDPNASGSDEEKLKKQPTASNGKVASGTPTENAQQAALKMNHALSMVSFRIYNDGTYKNTGNLTKIVLKNTDSNTDLNNGGTTPTMKISDGSITAGSNPSGVTYTRFIGKMNAGNSPEASKYKLVTIGSADDDGVVAKSNTTVQGYDAGTAAKAASTIFSIMVLPVSTATSSNVKVVFTIDDAEYSVPLGNGSNDLTWEKGKNNIYTAVLSGKGLEISTVTVAEWTSNPVSGDLPIN